MRPDELLDVDFAFPGPSAPAVAQPKLGGGTADGGSRTLADAAAAAEEGNETDGDALLEDVRGSNFLLRRGPLLVSSKVGAASDLVCSLL